MTNVTAQCFIENIIIIIIIINDNLNYASLPSDKHSSTVE